jgi:DNA-directed RNA polymerase specialized sigma24 family protein
MPADAEGARSWLFVTTRNTLLNHYSSSRRQRGFTAALCDELRTMEVDDPTEQNLEVREKTASLTSE